MAKEEMKDLTMDLQEESFKVFDDEETEKKSKKRRKKGEGNGKSPMDFLFDLGAKAVDGADQGLILLIGFLKVVWEKILDGAGSVFTGYDKLAEFMSWASNKAVVQTGRKIHSYREKFAENSRTIAKHGLLALVVAVCGVTVYASAIDYEYAYNGRKLGFVREQKDVTEVLGLVSEQLSKEYGAQITIDPTTDIEFRPVITYGKQKDTPDTVLKRFTYMGDIQAQGYSLVIDGVPLLTLESEEVANKLLQEIQQKYLDDDVDYEEVSFVEDIKLEPYTTTVSTIYSEKGALKRIMEGKQKEVKYEVVDGDSFYGICSKLDISADEIKKMNPGFDEDSTIHVGDEITIQKPETTLTVRTAELGTFSESIPYETEYEESNLYYEGESRVKVSGEDGKAKITAKIIKENGVEVDKETVKKEVIAEPVTKIVIKGTKKAPPKIGSGFFIRPVPGIVTSPFGYRWGALHKGTDFNAYYGETVRAADGGRIIYAGYDGSYGNIVRIDHGQNRQTWYAHLSSIDVSVGESVFQGQRLGGAGATGLSFGVHCHWEVRINGTPVNGLNYL